MRRAQEGSVLGDLEVDLDRGKVRLIADEGHHGVMP